MHLLSTLGLLNSIFSNKKASYRCYVTFTLNVDFFSLLRLDGLARHGLKGRMVKVRQENLTDRLFEV